MSVPTLSPELISLLRCPLTRQTLRLASAEECAAADPALEGALIREDGQIFYPIAQGIPLLVPDEARPWTAKS